MEREGVAIRIRNVCQHIILIRFGDRIGGIVFKLVFDTAFGGIDEDPSRCTLKGCPDTGFRGQRCPGGYGSSDSVREVLKALLGATAGNDMPIIFHSTSISGLPFII